MSDRKTMKFNPKKRVVFTDLKSESLPTMNTNSRLSRDSITTLISSSLVSYQSAANQRSISPGHLSITDQANKANTGEKTSSENEVLNDQIDLSINTNGSQTTFDLLEKIRQTAQAEPIGPMPLSLQACRFELPFDLKLLENLTPLNYLSTYCRLSSRRQYQFKRLFDKYRNRNYHFESSYLYSSLLDIHKHHLTYQLFEYLCRLIDLNEQNQFPFNTYAGILALCERILYRSSVLYKDQDDYNLTKDAIEKCDFYSLDRKLDGLVINDTMKRLLNAL